MVDVTLVVVECLVVVVLRVVVAGRVVVGGFAGEVVCGEVLGFAILVAVGTYTCVVDVLVVVASVVHSSGSVQLSSSAVVSSQGVVSSAVTVSVSVGPGSGGARKRLAKMNVSRIAARKRPMKIAVRLSFLFLKMGSRPLSNCSTLSCE